MRVLILLFIGFLLVKATWTECINSIEDDCEYEESECEYSDDCSTRCDGCDCAEKTYRCKKCCSSCCTRFDSCKDWPCCSRFCNRKCKGQDCKTSCKQKCHETVTTVNNTSNHYNITTGITLHNLINNNNHVIAPVHVNNTNVNFLPSWYPWGVQTVTNITRKGYLPNCCIVMAPRQCERTNEFPYVKCYYRRVKACGEICESPIVHSYSHGNCPQPPCLAYIPQPRPPCGYVPNWPYTSCGFPQQPNCEGCYGHYFGQVTISCSSFCYDEGFGTGQYYRRGPFYRPCFRHTPPCYLGGFCDDYRTSQDPCGSYPGWQSPGSNFPYPFPGLDDVIDVPNPFDANSIQTDIAGAKNASTRKTGH